MADAEKSDQKTESMCALLDVTARTRHRNGKIRRDFFLIEQTNLCSDQPKKKQSQQTTNPATDGSFHFHPNSSGTGENRKKPNFVFSVFSRECRV